MLIGIIGDVHGTTYWKKHINFSKYSHIVIMGDYFDNWKNNWDEIDQIANLQNILDMKRLYGDKMHVLIGNHDLAYLIPEIVSGHQANKAIDIKEFLNQNIYEFDVACKIDDWVFSHAGFSCYWMKKFGFINIDEVNETFHYKNFEPFKFYGGDPYGNDVLQGPTWVRPEALKFSSYFNKQIVGHTATDRMQTNHLRFKGITGDNQEIFIVDKHDHTAFMELEIKEK